jgi:hypothetical protein
MTPVVLKGFSQEMMQNLIISTALQKILPPLACEDRLLM